MRPILILDQGNTCDGEPIDLFGYIRNELDAHKIGCVMFELPWTASMVEEITGPDGEMEGCPRSLWLKQVAEGHTCMGYHAWAAGCLEVKHSEGCTEVVAR